MEYIQSSRGNRKLIYEGFVYVLDKKKETSYWRCERRSGKLSTLVDTLWQKPSEHSHPPDSSRVAVERAEHSKESTSNIIQNCTHTAKKVEYSELYTMEYG